MKFLEPKEIDLNKKTFIIHKLPASVGFELALSFPGSFVTKNIEASLLSSTAYTLLSYVKVKVISGEPQALSSKDHIDAHLGDWINVAKLCAEMIEYNCSFLEHGQLSTFFKSFAPSTKQSDLKTSMDSLRQSSQTEKRPFTN